MKNLSGERSTRKKSTELNRKSSLLSFNVPLVTH